MKNELFREKYKKILTYGSMKEVELLFKEQKYMNLQNKFVKIHLTQIKEYFFGKNPLYTEFGVNSSGINPEEREDIAMDLTNLAVDSNRSDVVKFLFKNGYFLKNEMKAYSTKIVELQETSLKELITDNDINHLINEQCKNEMFEKAAILNSKNKIKLLCKVFGNPNQETVNKILLSASREKANEVVKGVLLKEFSFYADIDTKIDIDSVDNYFKSYVIRESVLVHAFRNQDKELLEFIFSSEREKRPNVEDSLKFLVGQANASELLRYIILDLNIPYTKELKELLLEEKYQEYKTIFEKREFNQNLQEKLPTKNIKGKTQKI